MNAEQEIIFDTGYDFLTHRKGAPKNEFKAWIERILAANQQGVEGERWKKPIQMPMPGKWIVVLQVDGRREPQMFSRHSTFSRFDIAWMYLDDIPTPPPAAEPKEEGHDHEKWRTEGMGCVKCSCYVEKWGPQPTPEMGKEREAEITISEGLRERLLDASCKMSLNDMRWLVGEIGKRIPTPQSPPLTEKGVEEHAAYLRGECTRLAKGSCHTLACIRRGGYNGGDYDPAMATCIPYEISQRLAGRASRKVLTDEECCAIAKRVRGNFPFGDDWHNAPIDMTEAIARAVRDACSGEVKCPDCQQRADGMVSACDKHKEER